MGLFMCLSRPHWTSQDLARKAVVAATLDVSCGVKLERLPPPFHYEHFATISKCRTEITFPTNTQL